MKREEFTKENLFAEADKQGLKGEYISQQTTVFSNYVTKAREALTDDQYKKAETIIKTFNWMLENNQNPDPNQKFGNDIMSKNQAEKLIIQVDESLNLKELYSKAADLMADDYFHKKHDVLMTEKQFHGIVNEVIAGQTIFSSEHIPENKINNEFPFLLDVEKEHVRTKGNSSVMPSSEKLAFNIYDKLFNMPKEQQLKFKAEFEKYAEEFEKTKSSDGRKQKLVERNNSVLEMLRELDLSINEGLDFALSIKQEYDKMTQGFDTSRGAKKAIEKSYDDIVNKVASMNENEQNKFKEEFKIYAKKFESLEPANNVEKVSKQRVVERNNSVLKALGVEQSLSRSR